MVPPGRPRSRPVPQPALGGAPRPRSAAPPGRRLPRLSGSRRGDKERGWCSAEGPGRATVPGPELQEFCGSKAGVMVTDKRNPQPKPCNTDGTRHKSRSLSDPRKTGGASPAKVSLSGLGYLGSVFRSLWKKLGLIVLNQKRRAKVSYRLAVAFSPHVHRDR